jgi:hypothetical protein
MALVDVFSHFRQRPAINVPPAPFLHDFEQRVNQQQAGEDKSPHD